LEDKIGLLAADAAMRRVPGLTVVRSNLEFLRERKMFASSEGSFVEQEPVGHAQL
jgi:hypothetical protein